MEWARRAEQRGSRGSDHYRPTDLPEPRLRHHAWRWPQVPPRPSVSVTTSCWRRSTRRSCLPSSWLTLSDASGGRLVLGVGVGARPDDYRGYIESNSTRGEEFLTTPSPSGVGCGRASHRRRDGVVPGAGDHPRVVRRQGEADVAEGGDARRRLGRQAPCATTRRRRRSPSSSAPGGSRRAARVGHSCRRR